MAIEIAWGWLQHQPQSELSRWYYEVFGDGGRRRRKVGIVAIARKLLAALWHYLEREEIPAGAEQSVTIRSKQNRFRPGPSIPELV